MRRRLRPLLLSLVIVAGFAAGCGSGDLASEEVPGDPPVLTIPRERGSEDALADTGSASDDNAGADATPTPTPTPTPAEGDSGAPAPAATATPAPAADAPGNDQAPAEGTAPDKFEEFCQQNEGAC
jgi:hypothetical protein